MNNCKMQRAKLIGIIKLREEKGEVVMSKEDLFFCRVIKDYI